MSVLRVLIRRELHGYFATPVAYVFIAIFLMLSGVFTFYLGRFLERGQADLIPFFSALPWLYLVLIPAIAMRLWSEERHNGSVELLLTLPISAAQAVLAKFIAAWLFVGLALCLTAPLWVTVNYLGNPDNGVIVASYAGSWLMAGGYIAIGSCFSAGTRNQVVAFILTLVTCLFFVAAGMPMIQADFTGWIPVWLSTLLASISFSAHFDGLVRGVVDVRDLCYFLLQIAVWLYATTVVLSVARGARS